MVYSFYLPTVFASGSNLLSSTFAGPKDRRVADENVVDYHLVLETLGPVTDMRMHAERYI